VRRAVALLAIFLSPVVRPAAAQGIPELHEAISGLSNPMRVLVIAAHPDDEDTQLITWLARARHVETAYLSLTRGDGGQNLIGNELGEALGVIRTEELLAARRIDGGRQYFTRAYDFGFSKNADETFRHWPKDSILRDVVTVVRSFKPHVIVAMFSGTPRDGHGQHQASGILAREAYDLAGDGVRFPRAVTAGLDPWTPLKFYRGAWGSRDQPGALRINVGEFDAMLGRSYAEIAAQSRSQHKSQGFGSLEPKGVRFTQIRREASRVNESQPADRERSMFDGIDTTWARFTPADLPTSSRGSADSIRAGIARAQAAPYLRDPGSVIAPLTAIVRGLFAPAVPIPAPFVAAPPRPTRGTAPAPDAPQATLDFSTASAIVGGRAQRALAIATGIAVEATIDRPTVAIDDTATLTVTVYNRGKRAVRATPGELSLHCGATGATMPAARSDGTASDGGAVIPPDSSRVWTVRPCVNRLPVTLGPWWLDTPRVGDMFSQASTARSEGEMTRGPAISVAIDTDASALEGTGTAFAVATPIVYRVADPIRGDVRRPVAHVPELSVTLERAIEYAPATTPIVRQVRVELRSAATASRDVRVSLRLPAGLRADSAVRTVTLPAVGAVRSATFTVRGELPPGRHAISVVAEANGRRFTTGYTSIEYDHIRPQRLYRDATLAIEAVDLKVPPDAVIAYIQGVGDNSAPMLQQLGLRVSVLDAADIPKTDLSRFTAIVVGTRAYESNEALVANNAALLDYVKRGGTMVVQYGQYEMQNSSLMPYPITISRPADRVTDEGSAVLILDPKARVLTYPNAISAADFAGWVQDRSLYMPRTHALEYAGVVSTNDPGEQPNDGGILVARYGEGAYVYTTFAFFRQLPNGVPGAARLFLNLLAARAPERRAIQ